MHRDPPLSALLSHALVAFTIEFDNEFEHRTPHRTTINKSEAHPDVPWLVSLVMWAKFMRFVPEDGICARDFVRATGLPVPEARAWLRRMAAWWGYVAIERPASGKPAGDTMIRPTPGGRKAIHGWRPLTGIVEKRWEDRFGKDAVDNLRESLTALTKQCGEGLPPSLPILQYGLASSATKAKAPPASIRGENYAYDQTLPALFSKALLAFAIEFENESQVSLAISANVLRVVGDEGVRVSEIPALAGVSEEAIAMAVSFLEKRGFAKVTTQPAENRRKLLKLTPAGTGARRKYDELVWQIEERWASAFGKKVVGAVRNSLQILEGEPGTSNSLLFRGLEPYPDCWRAALPRARVLPDFPMVLHRGGFPDGS